METPHSIEKIYSFEEKEYPAMVWFTRVLGSYFGFPTCCVNACLARILQGKNGTILTNDQEIACNMEGEYTGFIPCQVCSSRIVNLKLEPEILIFNRKSPKRFPFGNNPETEKMCKGGFAETVKDIFLKDGYDKEIVTQIVRNGKTYIQIEPNDQNQ